MTYDTHGSSCNGSTSTPYFDTEICHGTTPLGRATSVPSTSGYSTICRGNLAWAFLNQHACPTFITVNHRSWHNGLRVLERRQPPTQMVLK